MTPRTTTPMSLREVIDAHAAFRRRRALAAAEDAADLWRQIDPSRIAASWMLRIARLMLLLPATQRVVAGRADSYLDEVLDAQRIDAASAGRVDAAALAGVASDGRNLATLLYRPVVATLVGFRGGKGVDQALGVGADVLDRIVRTQVADAGRIADHVATVARPQVTGYVRMLVGDSCARCVILAGRRYEWNTGFRRHDRCDCVHIPASEDSADDIRTEPGLWFRSLSTAEQDRVFGKAGAEAIRAGADISRVVNARRGMYTAAGRRLTREAAGRRPRLMPETILAEARDRDDAIRLLKRNGFIL